MSDTHCPQQNARGKDFFNGLLEVKVTAHPFEGPQDANDFSTLFTRHGALLQDCDLYVLHLFVGNHTHRAMVQQVQFMIWLNNLVVFDVREIGHLRAEGTHAFRLSEVLQEPESSRGGSSFTNQYFFRFAELALDGGVHYLILGGKDKRLTDLPLPRNIECYGTYTFTGYGVTEIRKFEIQAVIAYQ